MAAPIPFEAPVTIATFPASSVMIALLFALMELDLSKPASALSLRY
jgi:hypothetical protein